MAELNVDDPCFWFNDVLAARDEDEAILIKDCANGPTWPEPCCALFVQACAWLHVLILDYQIRTCVRVLILTACSCVWGGLEDGNPLNCTRNRKWCCLPHCLRDIRRKEPGLVTTVCAVGRKHAHVQHGLVVDNPIAKAGLVWMFERVAI